MSKKDIRKSMLAIRLNMPHKEYIEKSMKITERLLTLPDFIKSRSILFYMPIKKEVNTENMIIEAIRRGKHVLLPLVRKETYTLDIYEITSFTQTVKGNYGILEPNSKTQKRADPWRDIDLVILPGVAFDKHGNRVGYGKGYYDRFFFKMGKYVKKIGLAFEFQLNLEIERFSHDFRADTILTECRTIYCSACS